jgi:two-component system chemotaxis response regulator CheB
MMTLGTRSDLQQTPTQKNRVLVVDDSFVVRGILRRTIEADPEIEIVDCVSNGKLAVEALDRHEIDVIILDIEMPIMDGLTALPLLLKKDPKLVVIVASTLTLKNADISLKCLALGAKDYIPKPTNDSLAVSPDSFKREILEKIKTLGALKRGSLPSSAGVKQQVDYGYLRQSGPLQLRALPFQQPRAICIGSSTGGPQALSTLLANMKNRFKQPLFIAQHMPPFFTKSLAAHLEKISGITAKEGEHGERVQDETIYVAPGNYHMEIKTDKIFPTIHLSQSAPESFCRPSVNPLLRSVIQAYEGKAICLMLTGMGSDGLQGAEVFVKEGGAVIAQDEASSVVWGMPGAVASAGLCSAVIPLSRMGETMVSIANSANPKLGVKL